MGEKGESRIRWTTLTEDFPDYRTLNRDFGGPLLPQGFQELKCIIHSLEPSLLPVHADDNNIAVRATSVAVSEDFRNLMHIAHRL